jgi:hypothetical protein
MNDGRLHEQRLCRRKERRQGSAIERWSRHIGEGSFYETPLSLKGHQNDWDTMPIGRPTRVNGDKSGAGLEAMEAGNISITSFP